MFNKIKQTIKKIRTTYVLSDKIENILYKIHRELKDKLNVIEIKIVSKYNENVFATIYVDNDDFEFILKHKESANSLKETNLIYKKNCYSIITLEINKLLLEDNSLLFSTKKHLESILEQVDEISKNKRIELKSNYII